MIKRKGEYVYFDIEFINRVIEKVEKDIEMLRRMEHINKHKVKNERVIN